jgi:hypothetical protein
MLLLSAQMGVGEVQNVGVPVEEVQRVAWAFSQKIQTQKKALNRSDSRFSFFFFAYGIPEENTANLLISKKI